MSNNVDAGRCWNNDGNTIHPFRKNPASPLQNHLSVKIHRTHRNLMRVQHTLVLRADPTNDNLITI
jgi:hypothetical protein